MMRKLSVLFSKMLLGLAVGVLRSSRIRLELFSRIFISCKASGVSDASEDTL